mgnify:CR=1 FL=1|tara:strand:- start:720 stop:1982 length:1263 start_codon:yes stop_codon:yes gene_type:complete
MATANKLSPNRGPYEGSTSVFVLFFWFFTFYSPLFIVMNKFVLTLTYFFFSIIYYFRKTNKIEFNTYFIIFFSLLLISLAFQVISSSSIEKDIGVLICIFSTYLVIKAAGARILFIYLRVLYGLSVVSLIFYIFFGLFSLLLGDLLFDYLANVAYLYEERTGGGRYSFILFNFEQDSQRFFGPFWEPAIYAYLLFFGLIIYEILKANNVKLSNKIVAVFYISLLATQSTGGYIFLFLHLIFFNHYIKNNYLILFSCLFLGAIAYVNVSFLGEKISSFLAAASGSEFAYHYYGGRLNFEYMFTKFLEHPFFGGGRDWNIDYSINFFLTENNPRSLNGYAGILLGYGIFTFIFYNFINYVACKNLLPENAKISEISILLLCILLPNVLNNTSFSPIFYLICFFGICFDRNTLNKYQNINILN